MIMGASASPESAPTARTTRIGRVPTPTCAVMRPVGSVIVAGESRAGIVMITIVVATDRDGWVHDPEPSEVQTHPPLRAPPPDRPDHDSPTLTARP